jgi:hypothetical protein
VVGRSPRTVLRLVVALAPVVLAAMSAPALVLALRDRLPDQAYGTGGYTDSESWGTIATLPLVWAAVVVGLVTSAVLRAPAHGGTRLSVALASPIAVATATFVAGTVGRNLDRAAAAPGPEPLWAQSPVAEVVLLVAALLGGLVDRAVREPPPVATSRPGAASPRLNLGSAEVAVWTRTVRSAPTLVVGTVTTAAIAAFLAATTGPSEWIGVVLLLLVALRTLAGSWVRIRVDAERVAVVQPLLRRSLIAVPLRQVAAARVRRLQRGEFGPFAYGLVDAGRVFGHRSRREGEVLALLLADGREFVATTADAATAAALVTTLLERRDGGRGAGQDRSDVERSPR